MAQLIDFVNTDDLPTVVNLDEVRYAYFIDKGTPGGYVQFFFDKDRSLAVHQGNESERIWTALRRVGEHGQVARP